ncbi:MAG: hypothetical protein IPP29_16260 [Bacteroidetes bacterium]|nr:hypothetical protein [Bacteroidota bacterium]
MANSNCITKVLFFSIFFIIKVDCISQSTFSLTPIGNYYLSLSTNANINLAVRNISMNDYLSGGVIFSVSRAKIQYNFGIVHDVYSNKFLVYEGAGSFKKNPFKINAEYPVYSFPIYCAWAIKSFRKKIKTTLDCQAGINLLSLDYSKINSNIALEGYQIGKTNSGDPKSIDFIVITRYDTDGMKPAFFFGLNFRTKIIENIESYISANGTLGIYNLSTKKLFYHHSTPKEPFRMGEEVSLSSGTNFRLTVGFNIKLFTLQKKKV